MLTPEVIHRCLPSIIPRAFQHAGLNTFADFFCGIGGFHYAAASLGLRCVYACDIDEPAARQYRHNFHQQVFGDLTRTKAESIPDHDVLCAGLPCQPFSIIGKRGGVKDSRGTLFQEICRLVEAKHPKAVILENVKQMASDNSGHTVKEILNRLQHAGYSCDWKIVNALDCGLPQKRERLIIVALLHGLHGFHWPKKKTTRQSLTDILEPSPDQRHFVSPRIFAKRQAKATASIVPGIWHENKSGHISIHPYSCALRAEASYNYLLVDGKRRFTPRELLRLQGFPERCEIIGTDGQIRKQAGNAVPVPMIRAILRQILHAESENEKRSGQQSAVSA